MGHDDEKGTTAVRVIRGLIMGAASGAAGTTVLNAATYVDMIVRGRDSSSAPEDNVGNALG